MAVNTDNTTKSKDFHIRLTPDEYNKLTDLARLYRRTRADMIRVLVDDRHTLDCEEPKERKP